MLPPISGAAPGIKLGLANVAVMIMLYMGSFVQAAAVSLVRALMAGLVFAGPSTLLFSFAGGVLSLLVMAAARRCGLFSPLGVSMLGGVFHNVGQIAMAMGVLRSALLIGYLPVLLVAGAAAGAATGAAAAGALRYLQARPDGRSDVEKSGTSPRL
jgi:heptaprenyl diphosphate synthase